MRHHNRDHFSGDADPSLDAIGDVVLDPPPAAAEVHGLLGSRGTAMLFPLLEGRHLKMANVDTRAAEPGEHPTAMATEGVKRLGEQAGHGEGSRAPIHLVGLKNDLDSLFLPAPAGLSRCSGSCCWHFRGECGPVPAGTDVWH